MKIQRATTISHLTNNVYIGKSEMSNKNMNKKIKCKE